MLLLQIAAPWRPILQFAPLVGPSLRSAPSATLRRVCCTQVQSDVTHVRLRRPRRAAAEFGALRGFPASAREINCAVSKWWVFEHPSRKALSPIPLQGSYTSRPIFLLRRVRLARRSPIGMPCLRVRLGTPACIQQQFNHLLRNITSRPHCLRGGFAGAAQRGKPPVGRTRSSRAWR